MYYVVRGYFVCVAQVITNHIHIKKLQINHGNKPAATRICNISANIACFFIPNKLCSPHKLALMMICYDLHGKEKPLSSPSCEIVDSDFRHDQILAIREEEQGHF